MALASSAQVANIAAPARARRPAAATSSSLTRSLPSVFKRGEISEFAGLKSTSSCITYGRHVRENNLSLFDAVASQVVAKAGNTGAVRGETVAKMKVAINGFGRIGRNFMRCWHGHKRSPLEIVAINDTTGVENAAHLLKYDSIMGKFEADVEGVFKATDANGHRSMSVGGKQIFVLSERDPSLLPWKDLGVDLVIEATGKFTERTQAEKHIAAGAKKVIITAPGKGDDIPTYVVGINDSEYSHDAHDIISNGSGTINCLAPLIQTLDKEFGGIVKGTVAATLSYTSDQSLLDAIHCDKRRSRAAALNIVPTNIDMSINSLSRVLPSTLNLKDKFNGIAMRVPTPNVSVVDLVVNVGNKGFTVDDVRKAFKKAASDGPLHGILGVCEDHLVSMDFRGSNASAIVDTTLTMVVGEDMIKVVAWFDNEWAYSQRVVEFAHTVHAKHAVATGEVLSLVDEQICTVDTEHIECKIHDV